MKTILDYGAIPDEDSTAAFQKAADVGGTVYVPAGTWPVSVSHRPTRFAVNCPKSLELVGEGRDLSRIVTEETLSGTGNTFGFRPNTRAVFHGLTLQGPINLGDFFSVGIVHYGGHEGSLRIDQCEIAGGHQAMRIEELGAAQSEPELTLLDSLIRSPTGFVHVNSGQCRVVRTHFAAYGVVGSNQFHAIYTALPVRLVVEDSTFHGNRGDGFDIQAYSPATPGRGSITIRDTEFQGKGTRGILTHDMTRTFIENCRLGTVMIQVRRGGLLVSDSTLGSKNQVQPWPYPPGAGTWAFRDCLEGVT